jgi:hypothetical protein
MNSFVLWIRNFKSCAFVFAKFSYERLLVFLFFVVTVKVYNRVLVHDIRRVSINAIT